MELGTNDATMRQQAYAKKIEHQATQHRTVRNPEALLQNRLMVEAETDCFGKYQATHSFKKGGQVFHRSYSLTPTELHQFKTQNPNIEFLYRGPHGINPSEQTVQNSMPVQNNVPVMSTPLSDQQRFSSPGQVSAYMADNLAGSGQGPAGFSHLEYSNSNLPIPMSSFQHSFNLKHGAPVSEENNRTFDTNVLQHSNISGNSIGEQAGPNTTQTSHQLGRLNPQNCFNGM